jgi:DNA-binding MarR family transcriptional regulator
MISKDKKFDCAELDYFEKELPGMDKDLFTRFIGITFNSVKILGLLDHYLSIYGMSQGRFHILMHLFRHKDSGGLSPSELSRHIGVKSASITGLVDTLEKNEMVCRQRDSSDRRKVLIKLTDYGESFLRRFLPQHQEHVRAFMSGITADENQQLTQLLKKVVETISSHIESLENTQAKKSN